MSYALPSIDSELLHRIVGGQGGSDPGYRPDDNAFGRVGPGRRMSWLGNYYTPEALRHDQAVRDHMANGSSLGMAHVRALPQLPAAAASYFRARFRPGPQDRHIP
jgi:hypothetical protein